MGFWRVWAVTIWCRHFICIRQKHGVSLDILHHAKVYCSAKTKAYAYFLSEIKFTINLVLAGRWSRVLRLRKVHLIAVTQASSSPSESSRDIVEVGMYSE